MSAVPAPESGPDAGAVWHYGDPLGEQRAAAEEAVVVDRSHRVVIELAGGERKSWLHTISSQHVSDQPDGTVTRGEVGGIQVSTLLLDSGGREVRTGDRLVPVEAQPYDLQFFPHPPKQQLKYGRLTVISVADMVSTGGPHDVIAISGGSREGIDNGTVFSLWRRGNSVTDKVRAGLDRDEDVTLFEKKVRLPDEFAGHAMVFRTFNNVSYALVMSSVKPTRIGYELKHPDAPY